MNFQGRLLSNTGAVVADGNYNMEFKIYSGGDGTATGDTSPAISPGSLLWTEDWLNNHTVTLNTVPVVVKNGYFSVQLGAITSLPASVNLDNSTMWLSMTVANGSSPNGATSTTCTTFAGCNSSSEPEMLPMKSLSAAPFALNADNANQVNSYLSNNLLDLAVPAAPTASLVAGGTLTLSQAYFYEITATNAAGETLGSTSATATPVSSGTQSIKLLWTQVNGATGYKIYRNTTNTFTSGSLLLTAISGGTTVGYTDTGTATSAGFPPATVSGTTITLQGWSGQTNNILQAETSTGTVVDNIDASGNIHIGSGLGVDTTTSSGTLTIGGASSGTNATIVDIGTTSNVPQTINVGQAAINAGNEIVNVGTASTSSGKDTVVVGSLNGASATTIQGGTGNINLNTNQAGSGIVVKTVTTNSTSAFQVQNSGSGNVLSVDTTGNNSNVGTTLSGNNVIGNSSVESAIAAANGNWQAAGAATVTQSSAQYYSGANSLKVATTTAAGDGAKQVLNATLTSSTIYSLTFYAKRDVATLSMTDLQAGYSYDSTSAHESNCTLNTTTVISNGWTRITCSFATGSAATAPTATNYIYIRKSNATTAETFYLDAFTLETDATNDSNYREGKITIQGAVVSPLILQNAGNSSTALSVQNSSGTNVLNVSTNDSNLVANPDLEVNTTGWSSVGSATMSRDTAHAYLGQASLQLVIASAATGGAQYAINNPNVVTAINTQYTVSFFVQLISGTAPTLQVTYSPEGTTTTDTCSPSGTAVTGGWIRFSCAIAADNTHAPTTGGYVKIAQTNSSISTWNIDSVQMEAASSASAYGDGTVTINGIIASPAVFQNSSNSTSAFQVQNTANNSILGVDTINNQVLFGKSGVLGGALVVYSSSSGSVTLNTPATVSTPYSITLPNAGTGTSGQCLQSASGTSSTATTLTFGSCGGGGSGNLNTVTLVPEYAGAVFHASGSNNSGYMQSDYDSTNFHNYYQWSTTQATAQTYDIITRYQIPTTSSSFTSSSFKVWDKADTTGAGYSVSVDVHEGSTDCYTGGLTAISGLSTSWVQQTFPTFTGSCTFTAGDVLTIDYELSSVGATQEWVYLGETSWQDTY